MNAQIAVIDYNMGNLGSVLNALAKVGADAEATSDPTNLESARGIFLPGVGAFGHGMDHLRQFGFVEPIIKQVRAGKPFMGVCLGMQMLAEEGWEHGLHKGLGLIPGRVERLQPPPELHLRIPHIGWNEVMFRWTDGLFRNLDAAADFYFVHSYVLRPIDAGVVSGLTEYGVDFAASVEQENIWATQFHPEKSHRAGLQLLANWVDMVASC